MHRRVNLQHLAAGAVVFGAAFFMRAYTLWQDGALHYQGYADEGVYYSATIALWHGELPYSDYVFLHPPGIMAVLTPFAGIGAMSNDSTGVFVARLAFLAFAALNAALVMTLVWRYGRIAAVGAGLFYAAWGVVAIPEASVQLVTVLNTAFLLTALVVQRSPRRVLLAGLLVGFACATKVWAVVFVPVLVAYIWVNQGRAAALRFVAGAVAMAVVVCAPFAITDPGRAWTSVVSDQLGRPHDGLSLKDALFTLISGLAPDGNGTVGAIFVAAVLVAIAAPLLVALANRRHPREWGDAPWLTVLLAVQLTMLLTAPVFYPPYAAFVGPGVALLFGGLLVMVVRRTRAAALLAVPVVSAAALATISGSQFTAINHAPLIEATAGHRCIWTLNATYLVQADAMSRNISNDCDFPIDGYGWHLINSDDARSQKAWQRQVRDQLENADAIMMGPFEGWYLDEANRDYIRANFHHDVQIDPGFFDVRERRGVTRSSDD